MPLYNPRIPSCLTTCFIQSHEFLYLLTATPPVFSTIFLSSCNLVLINQIGFVTVDVTIPANAAAHKTTQADSSPLFPESAIILFPFPTTKKLIDRAGTTPIRFGPSPLKSARHPSTL